MQPVLTLMAASCAPVQTILKVMVSTALDGVPMDFNCSQQLHSSVVSFSLSIIVESEAVL